MILPILIIILFIEHIIFFMRIINKFKSNTEIDFKILKKLRWRKYTFIFLSGFIVLLSIILQTKIVNSITLIIKLRGAEEHVWISLIDAALLNSLMITLSLGLSLCFAAILLYIIELTYDRTVSERK